VNPLALAIGKIEATLPRTIKLGLDQIAPGTPPETADAIAEDIRLDVRESLLLLAELIVLACHEPGEGAVIWGGIIRQNSEPNGKLLPGLSRKRTSAKICRILRALGLSVESPNKARN
jgi:hypothetical protein